MTLLDTTAASWALTRPRYRAPEVQTPATGRHRYLRTFCATNVIRIIVIMEPVQ